MRTFLRTALAFSIAILLAATPALAIIKIDLPISRVYKDASAVVLGEVTEVKGETSITCTLGEALKGTMTERALNVDVPAELGKRIQVGQPVVIFSNGDRSMWHVGDAWYRVDRREGDRWYVSGTPPMIRNFPGRTVALIAILRELRAGKRGIQDGIGHEFVGALHDRGNLNVKPTHLVAADVDGDKDLDLVVCTAEGVRLFLNTADRYADVTQQWGLGGINASRAAAGDVNGDGQVDLLLDRAIWINGSERFSKAGGDLAIAGENRWIALAEVNGDKLPDAVALSESGKLQTAINPGSPDRAWPVKSSDLWTDNRGVRGAVISADWGDDGACYVLAVHASDIVRYPVGNATAPASDFKRLTGITVSDYEKLGPPPFAIDLCTALDYDGNGRMDLVLLTRGGGITLANRGYGAFLINAFLHQQLRSNSGIKPFPKIPKLPFEIDSSVCVAPGKRAGRTGKGNAQNLLILRGDGQLFEMVNDRM